MKKAVIFLLLLTVQSLYAADLVVEEFGVSPTYGSIQSAINAASNGDRILIRNRAGGIPWLENLGINKSIELLSYENDSTFVMQGDITFSPVNNGTITIIVVAIKKKSNFVYKIRRKCLIFQI